MLQKRCNTSECFPGCSILPQFVHAKQRLCHCLPEATVLSAICFSTMNIHAHTHDCLTLFYLPGLSQRSLEELQGHLRKLQEQCFNKLAGPTDVYPTMLKH